MTRAGWNFFWYRTNGVKQRVLRLLLCLNNCETCKEKENLLELSNFQSVLTSRTWRPLACKMKIFTNFIILSLYLLLILQNVVIFMIDVVTWFIYTLLIHRDFLACVVINISHKSTWLWPTESTHPCHYKVSTCVGYCVACYYQELRGLNNQPLFEKWAPLLVKGKYRTRRSNGILALSYCAWQHSIFVEYCCESMS